VQRDRSGMEFATMLWFEILLATVA